MIDISVTGLIKSFDLEKKILDGITFQIDTGERVGLLGKNGAGKTTLFRILTGELDYDAGEVSIASGRRPGPPPPPPAPPAGPRAAGAGSAHRSPCIPRATRSRMCSRARLRACRGRRTR